MKSYYHRLRTRRGPLRAQVAVQHKILTAIWHMLAHDVAFQDLGADYFDRTLQHQAHRARRLLIELAEHGYDIAQLIPRTPPYNHTQHQLPRGSIQGTDPLRQ